MSTPMTTRAELRRAPVLGGLNRTVLGLELRRMLRNRRTVIFTLIMPIALFLLIGTNESYVHEDAGNGNVSAYIMISMAVYGAVLATTSGGAMVSIERALGWSRQLRLTPLAPAAYIATKMMIALVLGLGSVLAVYMVGMATGKPSMPVHVWILTALIGWVGSLVFAAFGLFMGYVLPGENVMQVLGPLMAVFAFVGGLFVPLEDGSTLQTVAQFTPMYGLAELARSPLTGETVQVSWVLNIVVWLVIFAGGAAWRFRRDTARV
ncbi:MAG TPA: ABC transporter permease [Nocardioidaceae bacterium]|nr:ABC transporter permease [Nocardioidaceae bacterium]